MLILIYHYFIYYINRVRELRMLFNLLSFLEYIDIFEIKIRIMNDYHSFILFLKVFYKYAILY